MFFEVLDESEQTKTADLLRDVKLEYANIN
jgi:hypothetical protein